LNHSQEPIETFPKGLANFAEVTDSMIVDQEEDEIAGLLAKPKSIQQLVCSRPFLGERDDWIGVEKLKLAVPVQEFIKETQFPPDTLVLTQFETDLSERFAISFCNDCQKSDLSLAPGRRNIDPLNRSSVPSPQGR